MDFNIEVRKKQLENLDQLISNSRDRVQSVLSYLGWFEEKVKKEEPLVQCPINPHHRISPKSWNQHIEKCIPSIEGYDLKSQFLSESLDNPTQSIYLDHNKKIEIITKALAEKGPLRLAWNGLDPDPRTADRWTSTYSSDERQIFYDYCIENTVGPPVPPEFTTIVDTKQEQEKSLSYEEILSQQRDAKRRRAKYKSVHINRKNHTEVIREVINGQMEDYKEWLLSQEQTNNGEERSNNNGIEEERKDEQERPHSSISRISNNSSSSRSTSRRCDRREDSKDRYRSRYYEGRKKYDNRDRYNHQCSSEERWHRNHSNERKRSRERDRRHSSRDRNKRSRNDTKKH